MQLRGRCTTRRYASGMATDDSHGEGHELIAAHGARLAFLEAFGATIEALIRGLLETEGIRIHTISRRVKTAESLRGKLARGQYAGLDEIHDLLGLRVITYFPVDAARVAGVIRREFAVDEANSVDKQDELDPDRFGYLSIHLVCGLNEQRLALAENRRFVDLKCEIQVRSVLQHAWAEIEHDLGYKTFEAVPSHIRRRFSRLAGLLELADAEFEAIQSDIQLYRNEVSHRIDTEPATVLLDSDSLTAFINTDEHSNALDQRIAALVDARLVPSERPDTLLPPRLQYAGINSVAELRDRLNSEGDAIVTFAERFLPEHIEQRSNRRLMRGVGILCLCHLLVGRSRDEDAITRYISSTTGANPLRPAEEVANKIFEAVQPPEKT
jgi:putative GTP pyrophosphokinase